MELGICIASLQPVDYKDALDRIAKLEKLLHTKFDFIEGINNASLMEQLIKYYPCYTLGGLIHNPNKCMEEFTAACILAKKLTIPNLMFGGYQTRISIDVPYTEMFNKAQSYGLNLMLEPLKDTYPATLKEVLLEQHKHKKYAVHVCLKNTEINHDDLSLIYPSYIKNCHISLALYLKYYKYIKHLKRVTLEL